MIDLEQLLHVPYIDPYLGFDISPDDTKVAYSWNQRGGWEIYEQLFEFLARALEEELNSSA